MFTEFDRLAMTRALALAERGLETTHPNPRVGCVVVKDERIVGEGWHHRAGEAHAEVAALRAAKESTAGATAYVTLEPCSHHGRTPPCVNALIEARITRVVFAVQDPNPRVSGQGAEALRRAGLCVEGGLMQAEATDLNVGFMKRMRDGRPWVRVKLAMSLDGRTALASGASQWITGEEARSDVQRWRARCSAVMTGVGTMLADDPQLNVRTPGFDGRQPLRIVLDSGLRSPPAAKMFSGLDAAMGGTSADAVGSGAVKDSSNGNVVIFTAALTPRAPGKTGAESGFPAGFQARRAALTARGVRVEEVAAHDGFLDLSGVLRRLAALEVNELLVEAGPTLAGQLLTHLFVDELLLYVAPKLLGPQGRPLVNLPELRSLQEARGFCVVETKLLGADLRLRLRPK